MSADAGETGQVAALTIRLPDCPVCLSEVSCDGTSYWCEGCESTWDIDGGNGQRASTSCGPNHSADAS